MRLRECHRVEHGAVLGVPESNGSVAAAGDELSRAARRLRRRNTRRDARDERRVSVAKTLNLVRPLGEGCGLWEDAHAYLMVAV